MLASWRRRLRKFGHEGLPAGTPAAYGFAVLCIVVAAAAQIAFARFSDQVMPSILYNPAIFVAALFAGIRAGFVAVGLSSVLIWWAFHSQYFGERVAPVHQLLNVALYVATAVLIMWVAKRYRTSGRRYRELTGEPAPPSAGANAPATSFLGSLQVAWRKGFAPNSLPAYGVAFACVAIATLIRYGFGWLGDEMLPIVSYYPAILVASAIGGMAAGGLALALSLAVVWLEFPGPWFAFEAPDRNVGVSIALYTFACLLTVWLAENYRRLRRRRYAPQLPLLQIVSSVVVAFAAVLFTTVVLLAMDEYLEADHLVLGYLLPTVIIAMHYGSTLAVFTCFAGGVAAAYFLFPPKFSFYVAEPLHAAELGFYLLLAILASKAVAGLTDDLRSGRSSRSG
jgi:K+-sensing histidine kinase KdpD